MLKTAVAMFICAALLFSAPAFAIDGQILINQSTVMAAGGFPYTITQPGSYKLSGNLVVTGNTDGIVIDADNVTIDLNGFTISGPVTCTGVPVSSCSGSELSTLGIGTPQVQPPNDIAVRNGSAVGFYFGALLGGWNSLVEEIHATSNHSIGISVGAAGGNATTIRSLRWQVVPQSI
jgi:hypothetical protein